MSEICRPDSVLIVGDEHSAAVALRDNPTVEIAGGVGELVVRAEFSAVEVKNFFVAVWLCDDFADDSSLKISDDGFLHFYSSYFVLFGLAI